MIDLLAKFGIWLMGLPEPGLWVFAVAYGYGGIYYGYGLASRLHQGEVAFPLSERQKVWFVVYLGSVALFTTLFCISSIIVSVDSRYEDALAQLKPSYRETLVFFKFSSIVWYGILIYIIRGIWKSTGAAQ